MQSIGQTDTLTIKLASAPATRNPSFWGSYAASSGGAMTDDQSIQPTVLNGTTPVTVLLTPPSGTKFYLTSFSMTNTDTAAVVASILLNGVAGITFTLQTGDVMQFGKNSDSWVVLGGNGAQKQALSLNWGQIGGTLSAQTDLQAALDAKANASSLGTAATHAATDFDPAGAAAAVTKTSLGLANVTNDAQTKAADVPNTAPAAGQLMVGNAGGTAYAPVSMSGAITMTSAGVTTAALATSIAPGAQSATDKAKQDTQGNGGWLDLVSNQVKAIAGLNYNVRALTVTVGGNRVDATMDGFGVADFTNTWEKQSGAIQSNPSTGKWYVAMRGYFPSPLNGVTAIVGINNNAGSKYTVMESRNGNNATYMCIESIGATAPLTVSTFAPDGVTRTFILLKTATTLYLLVDGVVTASTTDLTGLDTNAAYVAIYGSGVGGPYWTDLAIGWA